MPRWSLSEAEADEPEPLADIEDGEPETLWSGPVGMSVRLGLFGVVLFGLYLGVRATSSPMDIPSEAFAPAMVPDRPMVARPTAEASPMPSAPPRAATPRAATPATPVLGPLQGPDLPRRIVIAPQRVCDAIKVDEAAARWRRSPVHSAEWECMSTRAAASGRKTATDKVAKPRYDLFSMARGIGKNDVRSIRFKLSASDQTGLDEGSADVVGRLEALFKAMSWEVPEQVVLAMRLQQPSMFRDRGVTYQLIKERMTASSYNLIVTFSSFKVLTSPNGDAPKTDDASDDEPASPPKT